MHNFVLSLGILAFYACSDSDDSSDSPVEENLAGDENGAASDTPEGALDDNPDDIPDASDAWMQCPEEPVPLSHLNILPDAYKVILNAKSEVFGRVYRDYQGCYVRLQKPCEAELGFRRPILRVECPLQLRDPIFTQCRDSIRRHTDDDKTGCYCNTTGDDILCPGEPDIITYGDIEFDGVYNPRSERYDWIFVENEVCYVNAPLEAGYEPTTTHYNWKIISCPSDLVLSHFKDCQRQLLRRDKSVCYCEGVSENITSQIKTIDCPAPSFSENLENSEGIATIPEPPEDE